MITDRSSDANDDDETPVPPVNNPSDTLRSNVHIPTDIADQYAAREFDEPDDVDSSESDSEYHSFSDSDADEGNAASPTEADRQARLLERRMVLEAAGLVVKHEVGRRPPPRPV